MPIKFAGQKNNDIATLSHSCHFFENPKKAINKGFQPRKTIEIAKANENYHDFLVWSTDITQAQKSYIIEFIAFNEFRPAKLVSRDHNQEKMRLFSFSSRNFL